MKRQADAQCHAMPSGLKLGDLVLVRKLQITNIPKSDSHFMSQHLKTTNIKGLMITAVASSFSTTRNSSHFREFRTSDEEEGESWPDEERTSLCKDTGEPMEATPPKREGPLRTKEAGEEKHHGKESPCPMRVSRNPKRLTEEL
ncbi:hypothetical protein NDU88_002532 [Pleurodeles waltl]|uniref:Uncharacterized protein n=1 Tax=Pleurodeles waltl TaxID=8319 RepID=A0AAV7VZL7_PLEWA|nr:hypothetical protein NDU88_002532 [Pleurodeles waltl]